MPYYLVRLNHGRNHPDYGNFLETIDEMVNTPTEQAEQSSLWIVKTKMSTEDLRWYLAGHSETITEALTIEEITSSTVLSAHAAHRSIINIYFKENL